VDLVCAGKVLNGDQRGSDMVEENRRIDFQNEREYRLQCVGGMVVDHRDALVLLGPKPRNKTSEADQNHTRVH
jgi:hypothetical protein